MGVKANLQNLKTLNEIFIYERDKSFLKDLLSKSKHIPFSKAIIEYLAVFKDSDVPQLIINFSKKRFSKGYRASLLLLLDKYDVTVYLRDILELFLKDSYNTTWFCYSLIMRYIKKMDADELSFFYDRILVHDEKEKDVDKLDYHLLLARKISLELKRRGCG